MSLIKWTKPNTSDVIALISLAISIWLACTANSLANYANQMSNRAAVPRIEITQTELIVDRETGGGFPGSDSEPYSVLELSLSAEIKLDYGELERIYLVHTDYEDGLDIELLDISNTDINKQVFRIESDLFFRSKGEQETVYDRFYLIVVDSSKKMHRVLIEVSGKPSYWAKPTEGILAEVIYFEEHIENPEISYRILSDYELVSFPNYYNFKTHSGDDSISDEVSEEIEEVNQWFSRYGFSQ